MGRDASYSLMVKQAQEKDLLDPPPYLLEANRRAWQCGYLAALHDVSRGYFERSVARDWYPQGVQAERRSQR